MKLIITFTAFLLCTICSYGQQMPDSVASLQAKQARIDSDIVSSTTTLQLDTLHGKIPVLYTKGFTVRAKAIYAMVEKCAAFYEHKFPDTKFDSKIMILNLADWHKSHLYKYEPYGSIAAWPLIGRIFIASDKKAVGKYFGQKNNLPDSVLSVFDCIALHELGHIFITRANHIHIPEK